MPHRLPHCSCCTVHVVATSGFPGSCPVDLLHRNAQTPLASTRCEFVVPLVWLQDIIEQPGVAAWRRIGYDAGLRSRGRGFKSRSGRYQVVTTRMGDCLRIAKPFRYATNTKVNTAFHPSGYPPAWLGLRQGAFTYDGWQVTLCDPIWQVTLRIALRWVTIRSYVQLLTFNSL